MWASINPYPPPLITPPFRRRHFPISAANLPPPPANSGADEIGGLGHALLTTLSKTQVTNNTPNPKQGKHEKQKQEISGSDVLWAINKANVHKKKKNGEKMKKKKKKKYGEEESGSDDDFEDEDYSKVRPLIIKNEWITRLDDLEKHLKQLSDT